MVLIIFKMISTSGFLTASECTKFVFGRGLNPTGELTALPRPLAGLRGPTYKGQGRGGRGKGEGRGKERRRERGGKRDGRDRPFCKFLEPPLRAAWWSLHLDEHSTLLDRVEGCVGDAEPSRSDGCV